MILYTSLPGFDGNYSTSFLNLNADLTVNIALEIVTKINPEYLLISHKKGNEIFRYIYYTYEFINTVNAYSENIKKYFQFTNTLPKNKWITKIFGNSLITIYSAYN